MARGGYLEKNDEARALFENLKILNITHHNEDIGAIRVENLVGFAKVPLGLAGPLKVLGPQTDGEFYAPLATCEATLIASCARGCRLLNLSKGARFDVLSEGMNRAPVFLLDNPQQAVAFFHFWPSLQDDFKRWTESTSSHLRLKHTKASVIGSNVHVFCAFDCGDASGQNMVTKACQHACTQVMAASIKRGHEVKQFLIDGQMASDKKPSWTHVMEPRGVEVMAWATISDQDCRKIMRCSTAQLYKTHRMIKDGGIRNGQFGDNANTANITAAIFIATGQDAASVAEDSWSHLTTEYDEATKDMHVSIYFPSLTIGIVGGGTRYPTQKEGLRILGCDGKPGSKHRLAGLIACFSLALELSTTAAITEGTFAKSHMVLARGESRKIMGPSKL
ncbi:hypothetical protein jhhlp_005137 [Lomentospora prolificans]|uniref:hydroxymethylglutaryl-CoA reductase (NADPH) n=1 Tax=Lomentospora prolificans TaxID=41688 RepID=A0A2N3N7L0_9PEZI|nr:hypothetical protein jhhlp_005137 [Lomentospora prolificans]